MDTAMSSRVENGPDKTVRYPLLDKRQEHVHYLSDSPVAIASRALPPTPSPKVLETPRRTKRKAQ